MKSAWIAVVPLLFSLLCPLNGAPGESVDEYEMFPTLSLKVLKYVKWNGEDRVELGKKIRVGVYDRTLGKGYLEVFSKLCEKYPDAFELTELSDDDSQDGAFDLVYVAGKSKLPLALLGSFEGKPVLVVGEHERILERGGIIRFQVSKKNQAVYSINLKQATLSGLKIESLLSKGAIETIR